MRFFGLFIGIDRFRSPEINELTCARRDAEALFSLFADTLGADNIVLLTDEDATNAAIRDDLESRLQLAEPDDLVVVTFSGHGSDDHYLVTHDADLENFDDSCISLDELVRMFSAIRSKRVLLVLDCCFSGGAGARVFQHKPATRSLRSVEASLLAIADEGKVILTACNPTEEAIEDPARGHGLLTWHLLEGLQGPSEVATGTTVPLYPLLKYVTDRVRADASSFGHEQRPTVRGTVDGELSLPVLKPGAETANRFPDRAAPPVSDRLSDLVSHGIPGFLLEAWGDRISALNQLQRSAINDHGLLRGANLVIVAPTSSGKTLVGELAALKAWGRRQRTLFLLPMRALVGDQWRVFQNRYGSLGLRIIRATGETGQDVPLLLRGKYDFCLMTYEKATSLILMHPHILKGVGTVVVDEAQMLADRSRGTNLEFLLTLIRDRAGSGVRPQMVLLSAGIGDTLNLESWMSASLLRSSHRPIPLREGVLHGDGRFEHQGSDGQRTSTQLILPEFRKGSSQDLLIPLARHMVEQGEKLIIFRETKSETRSVARYLSNNLPARPATETLRALPRGDLSVASSDLREFLEHGVAFHNADLAQREREAIEQGFRDVDEVMVLVATTTVAMGVNTPASTVAIVGLEHPGEEPYSVAEYKNMVGRAGRTGFTDHGKSMIVCLSPADAYQAWANYIDATPEDLHSRFLASDPHLLIVRVMAAAGDLPMSQEDVSSFVRSSFGWHQRRATHPQQALTSDNLRRAFDRLAANGLIEQQGSAAILTPLGRVAGEAGIEIESVLRVVEGLAGVRSSQLNVETLVISCQLTTELEDLYFPVHKNSHKERQRWASAMLSEPVPRQVLGVLESGPQVAATLRAKKAACVLLWVRGTPMSSIEDELLTHMPTASASGPVISVANRCLDVLHAVARIADLVSTDAGDRAAAAADELAVRLEHGIPSAMVSLAKCAGALLGRGQYLALHQRKLRTFEAIASTSDEVLATILGSAELVAELRGIVAPEMQAGSTQAPP